jgi:hypothetical protein
MNFYVFYCDVNSLWSNQKLDKVIAMFICWNRDSIASKTDKLLLLEWYHEKRLLMW